MIRKKKKRSPLNEFVKALIDFSKGKCPDGLKVYKISKEGKYVRLLDIKDLKLIME